MHIRKATLSDLPQIFDIYARARKFMAENGNGTQWGNIKPRKELVESDYYRELNK